MRFRINHETCEQCELLGGQNRRLKLKHKGGCQYDMISIESIKFFYMHIQASGGLLQKRPKVSFFFFVQIKSIYFNKLYFMFFNQMPSYQDNKNGTFYHQ